MSENSGTRKIIHIDMDAFYASIEERDNPSIKGKPVVIARSPDKRGVVSTCNYEARKYGIHSAMPARTALMKCPHAVFIEPRLEYYKTISSEIFKIFTQYTPLVEPIAYDEAFLDVTDHPMRSGTLIAKQLKQEIKEKTQLMSSAGVSFTKYLAKIASGYIKPDGLTVITPEKASEFMDKLPINKLYGVGSVTEKYMRQLNINHGADLKKYSKADLTRLFKTRGERLYNQAHCIFDSQVNPNRLRKSISKEITFVNNVDDTETLTNHIGELSDRIASYLIKLNKKAGTIVVKYRDEKFNNQSKQYKLPTASNNAHHINEIACLLFNKMYTKGEKIRLIGIRALLHEEYIVEANTLDEFFNLIDRKNHEI